MYAIFSLALNAFNITSPGRNRNLEWWHLRVVYIHRYGERSYFHQTNAILMDWEICTKKSTKITPRTLFRCQKSKFTVGFHCSRHCTYLRILSALKQMLNCCQLIIVSLEQENDGCVYEMFLPYHVLLGPTTIWRYKIGRLQLGYIFMHNRWLELQLFNHGWEGKLIAVKRETSNTFQWPLLGVTYLWSKPGYPGCIISKQHHMYVV